MIDTIWLILHHSTVNYKIDFMAEVGAKINVDIKRSNEYRIVGSLQNMQIYIEPTFVLIQGSLPKYYYGSNLVSLPRTELSNAIDKLSTDLGLPLREAIITRIDIGMNVEVDNPPRSYFSYFGILKKFERNIRRNSLYYEQKWCQLCFYDKVKEAKAHKDPLLTSEMLDKNILRYEIRYKHSWLKHYFKRNIKAKELFAKDPIVYLDLIAEWYLKYDDIIKIDIMKPKFEMTLMGLLRWELKDRSRKQDILKIIDSFSEKGDRKAARLKSTIMVWKRYGVSLTLTNSMQRMCHEFDMNWGGSWGASSIIDDDNKEQYLVGSLMEEAIFSSQMEGAATTRKVAKEMLRRQITPKDKSQQMISNNYQTIQFIVAHKDTPLSPE